MSRRGSATVGQAKFNAGLLLLLLLGTHVEADLRSRGHGAQKGLYCSVQKKNWDFVMHIFFNVLRSGVSLEIYILKDKFFVKIKKTNIFYLFLIFSAMLMMLYMIWMEKTCKEDVCE